MSGKISESAWKKVLVDQVQYSSYEVTKRGGHNDVEQIRMYHIGSNVFVDRQDALAAQAELDAEDEVTDAEIEAGAALIGGFIAPQLARGVVREILEAAAEARKARHI